MKISSKISISFFATAVALTVIGVSIFYLLAKNSLEIAIYDHLTTTVQSRARHIETLLESYKKKVELVADSYQIETLFETIMSDQQKDMEFMKKANRELGEILRPGSDFYEIFVMDSDGMIAFSTYG